MQERKVFTHLVGKRAGTLNDTLTQTGFRRSQTIAYRPACENCRACVSVRVLVEDFRPSASQSRVLRMNADIVGETAPNKPTGEQYALFRALPRLAPPRRRHGRHVDARLFDDDRGQPHRHLAHRISALRPGRSGAASDGPLVGACLTDRLADGLSLVYSFYAPDEGRRSLGAFMILDHIAKARRLGLPHVYLGYWVEGSRKMAYKAAYLPQERLGLNGWMRIERG